MLIFTDIDDHIASQQINVPTSPGAVLPPENVPSPRNEENVQSPDQYYAMPSSTPPPSYSEAFRQAGGVLSESNGKPCHVLDKQHTRNHVQAIVMAIG